MKIGAKIQIFNQNFELNFDIKPTTKYKVHLCDKGIRIIRIGHYGCNGWWTSISSSLLSTLLDLKWSKPGQAAYYTLASLSSMWHINIISTISTSSSKRPPTHLFDRLHLNDGTVLTAAVERARGAVVVAVGELLSQDGRAAGTPLAQLWKRI